MPRPPETTRPAEVSSGRSLSATLSDDPLAQRRIVGGVDLLDRGRAARSGGLEGRGADRHDLPGVRRADRLDGVAGVDRPLERVGVDDAGDVGDDHHVQQRRDARHDVLGVGRRGRDDVVVALRQRRRSAPPRARPGGGHRARARRRAPSPRPRASPPSRPRRRSCAPQHSMVTSPSCFAAVSALAVASTPSSPSVTSARRRTAIRAPPLRS